MSGTAYSVGLGVCLLIAFLVVVPELFRAPKRRKRKVRVRFEHRDMWIGIYRDTERQRTYVCVIPCLPLVISRIDSAAHRRGR